jgi:hypothetical protein
LKKVKPTDLKDPELVKLAQLVQSPNKTDNYSKAENWHVYGRRADISTTLPAKKNVANTVTKDYPLIEHVGARKINHLVLYCNAVYAAQKP